MARGIESGVSVPKDWSEQVKSGLLCAVSLAHRAMTVAHSWCVNSRIARVRLAGDVERFRNEVALLREELRIKDARLARIPATSRPHYPPTERLAILALKAARAWNNAQTARAFLLTAATIASWLKRLDEQGEAALVKTPAPINRFDDYVALLIQQLKATCPTMGKVRIAHTLARAGLRLSASTARRLLRRQVTSRPRPGPTGTQATCDEAQRTVTSKRHHHVWHADLTAVPTALGFWSPWFPRALGQVWPFCFWVLVVVDNFTRRGVYMKSFRRPPTGDAVTRGLDVAIATAGKTPKYIVTDRGSQFRESYRDWCATRTILPRFGAIGQHGSIAICERFIRTLKEECTRRSVVPLASKVFDAELVGFACWYNQHRPHQSQKGCTPCEVGEGIIPAGKAPRFETRKRLAARSTKQDEGSNSSRVTELRLIVTPFEGRRHLPVVTLRRAA